MVKVISQEITLASRDGNSYQIAIDGEGTYREIETGLFKIEFELRMTNAELFGGTHVVKQVLYNSNSYTDPDPLTDICSAPVAL